MTRPDVLVTRPIMEAPLARLRERCDVTVDENDFGIPRDDLLKKVAGRDALITMLTERVDAELLAAAGPQLRIVANHAVGFDNVVLADCTAAGRPRVEHARRADRDHGRHRVRADHGRGAARRRGRAVPPPPRAVDLGAADDARPGRPPQDDRHRRVRPDRAGGRAAGEGLRDDGPLRATPCTLPPEVEAETGRGGSELDELLREADVDLDPHEPHARDPTPVLDRAVPRDEAARRSS